MPTCQKSESYCNLGVRDWDFYAPMTDTILLIETK